MRTGKFLILLFANAYGACATAESKPDLLDMDLATLMDIQVGADASVKGLSAPSAGGQVASGGRVGILSTQAVMDTPFSTTNYTQEFILNQQAASVGDALQYDPAVRVARGFGNFQQVYMIRGLPIFSDDMTYNGLYGILPRQYLASELIERVDVLHGANSFLNGAAPGVSGCLGGAVDVIPKRAPNEDLERITLGVREQNQTYAALDLATRTLDGSLGIRLNAALSDGDTALPNEARQLDLVSLGMDYRNTKLRVSADLGHQSNRLHAAQPSITIASNLAAPEAPSTTTNMAQPWTYSNESDLFGTLRAEYDISKNLTGWLAGGTRTSQEDSVLSAFGTTTNPAGDYTASRFDVTHNDDVNTGELGLRLKVENESVEQVFTLALNSYENNAKNAYLIYNSFSDNLYHPTPVPLPQTAVFAGGELNHPEVTLTTQTSSWALADELRLLKGDLIISLGARRQTMREFNYSYDTGNQISAYDESKTTPLLSALYHLSAHYSVYGNAIQGLLKGDTAPASNIQGAVANAGETLSPYQTKQLETGIKYDDGNLGGSLGVFQLRKPIAGYDANNRLTPLYQQTHQGVELSFFGLATQEVNILGGLSLLHTELQGKNVIGAPKAQGNLGLEWNPTGFRKITLSSDLVYTGNQYINVENSQQAPSWTRIDLGLRYQTQAFTQRNLILRAKVENATNNHYWSSVGGFPGSSYLTAGNPRTFILSASLSL